MKLFCFALALLTLFAGLLSDQTPSRIAFVSIAISVDDGFGVAEYPKAQYLPEPTTRLLNTKASTWLTARVYHTDDRIKDVTHYYRTEAERINKPANDNELLTRLLRDNWKINKGPIRYVPSIFGVGDELKDSKSNEAAETSFGIILLDDSIVRIHLMSPHPSSLDTNTVTPGTIIILIREQIIKPDETSPNQIGTGEEKVYTGREVTRKIRLKSKPEPEYGVPGIGGKVVLKAVFSASGKVTKIIVVSGLPDGFREAAIKAARKISFEPAIKDGHYVAQWVQLEYFFIP